MSLPRFAACWFYFFVFVGGLLLDAGPGQPAEDAAATIQENEPTVEQRILAALDKPMKPGRERISVADLAELLRAEHSIPVLIDKHSLADAGIDPESTEVQLTPSIRLRSALNLSLPGHNLAWMIQHEALLITTLDEREATLVTKVYPTAELMLIRDAFGAADELFEGEWDPETLNDVILSGCSPESWEANGGAGSLIVRQDLLLVSNTQPVHDQLSGLMEALHAARRQQFVADAAARYRAIPAETSHSWPACHRIRDVLRTKGDWSYDSTLEEIAAALAKRCDIPIALDREVLADAGVDARMPMILQVKGMTLANALEHMLREIDLVIIVTDDVLLITTRDAADLRPVTRLYPARDLALDLESQGGSVKAEELIEAIQSIVAPDAWECNGGNGNIELFPDSYCLVVSQTEAVHDQVEQLLAKLRALPTYVEPPLTPPDDAEVGAVLRLRSYRLTTEFITYNDSSPKIAELAAFLKDTVDPDAWKVEGVFIKGLSDRIVVNHTARMQRKVRKALMDLEVISTKLPGRPTQFGLNARSSFFSPRSFWHVAFAGAAGTLRCAPLGI